MTLFGFLKSSDAFKSQYDMSSKVLGQGKFAKVYKVLPRPLHTYTRSTFVLHTTHRT